MVRSTVVLWYLPGLHIHLQTEVSWEGPTQRPDLGEDWWSDLPQCYDTYLDSIYIFRLMSLQKGPLRGLTLEKIGGQIYYSAMIPTWTPYTSSDWCLLRRAHSEAWPWRRLVVRSTVVLWYLPELHIHLQIDVSSEGPTQRPDLGEDWWSDLLQCYDAYLNSIYIFRLMSLEKGPLRGLTLEKIGGQIYCSAMIPTWTPYISSDWCLLRRAHSEAWPWRRLVARSSVVLWYLPGLHIHLQTEVSWETPTQRPDLGEDWWSDLL